MAMEHSGCAPAPAATGSSVPSTAGPVTGDSYTDMLMAHLSSSAATWNDVAYPGSATATPSAAINGVPTAYPGPGELNLNAAVTAGPGTNTVSFGYAIDVYQGMADLGSERLQPTDTAAAAEAAATEPAGGGYYYRHNFGSGMALPLAAAQVVDEADMEGLVAPAAVSQDEVAAGAVADEPERGGLGGLGLAATSLATAGLIAGGGDTQVTAIALFGMLIAGVILVTARVLRA